jgi:hypothetical protein
MYRGFTVTVFHTWSILFTTRVHRSNLQCVYSDWTSPDRGNTTTLAVVSRGYFSSIDPLTPPGTNLPTKVPIDHTYPRFPNHQLLHSSALLVHIITEHPPITCHHNAPTMHRTYLLLESCTYAESRNIKGCHATVRENSPLNRERDGPSLFHACLIPGIVPGFLDLGYIVLFQKPSMSPFLPRNYV